MGKRDGGEAGSSKLGVLRTFAYAVQLCVRAAPGMFVVLLLIAAVGAALAPVVVLLARDLVDDIVRVASGGLSRGQLLWGAVLLGVTTRLQGVASQTASNHLNVLARDVTQHAAQGFYRKAASVDFALFDDAAWHDKFGIVARELEYRPGQLAQIVFNGVRSSVALLGLLGVLFALHPLLLLLALAGTLPSIYTYRWVNREFARHQVETTALARERSYLGELLSEPRAAKEVRAFDAADHFLQRHQAIEDVIRGRFAQVVWRTHRLQIGLGFLPMASIVGAYLVVANEATKGRLGAGGVAAIVAGWTALNASFGDFLQAYNQLDQHNAMFLRHYFSFLETESSTPVPAVPTALPAALAAGIELDHVSFRYPFGSEDALEDVTLRVRPGQLLALVGENGAGKTTIVKLLLRFYLPDTGTIRVGGVDTRDLDPAELRSRIGVLFQDFVAYELSARDNVALGCPGAPVESARIERALLLARADAVVHRLPEGLDTRVGRLFHGGHDLSGGEWQRLALARLLYRGSDIWVLDEPTSALDPAAEAAIFGELREQLAGPIGIIISHRFSTVRTADVIAVVHDGRILECGTHDELIELDGRYAQLFELQAAGYR